MELLDEMVERDSVILQLPAGYRPEFIPKPLDIQTPFGKYQVSINLKGEKLLYTRELIRNRGKFPASDYPQLVRFYEQVLKADRAKLVLVKEE